MNGGFYDFSNKMEIHEYYRFIHLLQGKKSNVEIFPDNLPNINNLWLTFFITEKLPEIIYNSKPI
jgi:hypothetical protein